MKRSGLLCRLIVRVCLGFGKVMGEKRRGEVCGEKGEKGWKVKVSGEEGMEGEGEGMGKEVMVEDRKVGEFSCV